MALFLSGPRVSVTLQTVTRTADGLGGFTESWANTETFNAILNPMLPKEAKEYGKDTAIGMYNMYIEVNGRTINEQNRILYGTEQLKIIGVLNPFGQDLFYKLGLERQIV